MLNKFCDSPIHKCCAFSLAFIFLFVIVLSVPAFADDVVPSPSPTPYHMRPNDPIGWKDGDTFRDLMLVVLDSWGISFSDPDPTDDVSILQYADDLMEEFYQVNQTTQDAFWDLVKYGVNQTGDIILDFLGVNKIRQIANWIKNKFSLTDNSTVSTALPTGYYLDTGEMITASTDNRYSNGSVFYIGQTYGLMTGGSFSLREIQVPHGYSYVLNNQIIANVNNSLVAQEWFFSMSGSLVTIHINRTGAVSQINWNTGKTLTDLFGNMYSSTGGLTIITNIINIPSDNDISPDDGLKIEVPGTNWGDSIITILDIIERLIGLYDSTQLNINTVIELISTLLQGLQQSVSVENIPGAVILDYDNYDISLETDWSLVDGFFSDNTEESPFSTLTAIIYGFPAPLILFFSVIVIFIIAYGFIRMGRDSH